MDERAVNGCCDKEDIEDKHEESDKSSETGAMLFSLFYFKGGRDSYCVLARK